MARSDPHRVLFPAGALLAIAGAIPWPLHALGVKAWPGELHALLMVQGFELAFVSGFLLTFLPRVTRTLETPRSADTAILTACVAAVAIAAWGGLEVAAHAAFLAGLLTLAGGLLQRFRRRGNDPPEEFVFIALGLALGVVGGAIRLAAATGLLVEPAPRFGLRLVSLGMILALVLGVGSILVPTFVGIRDPLAIPRVSGAHERSRRRLFYAALGVAFIAAFVLEAAGAARAGAVVRAAVALTFLLFVWKLTGRPTRAGRLGWVLWSAGWLVGAGLVAAALWPARAIGLSHLTLLGGYGFLTAGIATRVLVTHGGHGVEAERHVLDVPVVAALGLALAVRIGAEFVGAAMTAWLAASGLLWCAAWGWWLVRAAPRLRAG